jgi:WD40 repeat protein
VPADTLRGHEDNIYLVNFAPDGRWLATASGDNTAVIWDLAQRRMKHVLPHAAPVYAAVFSPDGRKLATASADRTLKLWDVATGKELLTLYGHADNVEDVAFSPDGRYLFSGSIDGTARMYVLPVDELVNIARSRATRGLTPEECETFLPGLPCPARP